MEKSTSLDKCKYSETPDPLQEVADISTAPTGSPELITTSLIRKELLFVIVFFILIFLAYVSPLKEYFQKIPELSRKIAEMGMAGPVIFIFSVFLLVTAGVPRLLLCPIGGIAFGFVPGLFYTVTGTIMSYYVLFLFIRWGGRDFVIRHFHKVHMFTKFLENGGIPAVILARQMPVHGMIINVILGLSTVRHRDFLIGTAIGLFPEAIPCTLVGSGVGQGSLGKSTIYMMLALLVLAVLWMAMNIYRKKAGPATGTSS